MRCRSSCLAPATVPGATPTAARRADARGLFCIARRSRVRCDTIGSPSSRRVAGCAVFTS